MYGLPADGKVVEMRNSVEKKERREGGNVGSFQLPVHLCTGPPGTDKVGVWNCGIVLC